MWKIERNGCGEAELTNTIGVYPPGITLYAPEDVSAEEYTLYLMSLEAQLNSGQALDSKAMEAAIQRWLPKISTDDWRDNLPS